ncbi:MAG: hypothetical protein AMXMBFR56_22140 [Polyangiaceae bacterium]
MTRAAAQPDITERFSVFAISDADCYLMLVRVERGCPPPGPFTRTLLFVGAGSTDLGGSFSGFFPAPE